MGVAPGRKMIKTYKQRYEEAYSKHSILLKAVGEVLDKESNTKQNYRLIPMRYKDKDYENIRKIIYPYYSKLTYLSPYNEHLLNVIDLGCGIGDVLDELCKVIRSRRAKESTIYPIPTGIDINKSYLKIAKACHESHHYIHDDIMNVDLSKYQIIYFYNPIRDTNLEVEFEKKVIREAKRGTIIIANSLSLALYDGKYSTCCPFYKNKKVKCINYEYKIFIKK